MQLLKFHPLIKRALWGGRRLSSELGKSLGSGADYAESWEVCDLPDDNSVVSRCRCTGRTLRDLMLHDTEALLGRQSGMTRFPLLVKFLDAHQKLSIQVHPSRAMAARRPEVTTGKAETWVVLQAAPGSKVYAGLKPGVDCDSLRSAASSLAIVNLLHSYEVVPGDCISLLPGTVHAIGEGLLLAEIQEPNNVTYRLSDWGRIDASGQPRELHLDLALEATRFDLGPVNPVRPVDMHESGTHERLVATEHFMLDRHRGEKTWLPDEDDRAHVLVVLEGNVTLTTRDDQCSAGRGDTLVVPAERTQLRVELDNQAILLDAWVDESLHNIR